jgi:TOMM system kinase/cyclase fusion protein
MALKHDSEKGSAAAAEGAPSPAETTMVARSDRFPISNPIPSSQPPVSPRRVPPPVNVTPAPVSPPASPRRQDVDSVTVTVAGIERALRQHLVGSGPQGTLVLQQSPAGNSISSNLAIPKKGDRIGGDDGRRFEIIERLGAGGMAIVLQAQDTILDRTVAIKVITHEVFNAGGADVVDRFKLEARASARLSHENIVRVFDLGTTNGVPFLVMEHLEGRPLDSLEAHDEIDTVRAVRILSDVARGLSHAHKSGIVHRDLKPSNVFILGDGKAKIVDFGLASVAFGVDSRGAEWHALAGTPRYMSPEQWKGEPQDGRTDIWAAGVMFFEMLVGHPPFRGESIFEVRNRVLSPDPAPLLKQFRPDLPEEAGRLIERALQKDVSKRTPTADELLDSLVALEMQLTRTRTGRLPAIPRVISAPARPKPERRQMTFLSCSLVGLMGLSEQLELDDFSELLASFFEVCATVVRQLEGTVLSNLGGRSVACFGYPVAHEDDAQRAVRAGFLIAGAIRNITRKDGKHHAAQIGVHTGMAIAGKLSDAGSASVPIIQGEAPDVATWLERSINADEIRMTRSTQALVRGMFEVEPLGPRTPDGASRAIETFRALRQETAPTRFAAHTLTPMVGRESESANLRQWWDRAKNGEGQFVMLSGEAGIGKSRMVELLKEHIGSAPHHLVICQSWLHFQNTALYPIATGLMSAAGIRPDSPASDKIRKLEAWLSDLDMSPEEYVPLLASAFSMQLSGGYSIPALSPDLLKSKVLDALITAVLRLAGKRPALLVVEDIHWSDTSTLELLGMLLSRVQSAALFLLVTFRPGFRPVWPEKSYLHRIALQRLSPIQTQAMAALACEGHNLPQEVMEQLVRRADGVPLFIEELTRVVSETWQEVEQRPEAQFAVEFAAETIPATLSELLLARLDKLADTGKEVVQLGAVLGRDFSYQLIQLAWHMDEHALRSGLMQLVEAGMIVQDGQGESTHYTFKHALLHDAAYQSLVRTRRKEHHLRAAQTLVKYFPEVTEPHPELIGHHFAEAGHPDDAIEYLQKAGKKAVERSANSDAVIHYSRALWELKTLPPSRERDRRELVLQLALGAPLMSTKGHAAPQVRETYARARELCEAAGDDASLFPAMYGLTQFYMVGGEPQVAAQLGRQLVNIAQHSGDNTMQMLAHRAIGPIYSLLGEFVLYRNHFQKALALYDRSQHQGLALQYGMDPGVASGSYISWALWFLGFADQAVLHATDALRLAQEVKHPTSIVFAHFYLSGVHNYRGEPKLARETAEAGLKIAVEHKLAMWIAMFKIQLGWAISCVEDQAAGIDLLKEGLSGWRKTGARAGVTYYLTPLSWALWRAGKFNEALNTLAEAEEVVATQGERCFEPEIERLRGEILLSQNPDQEAEAEERFRKSLARAREQEARSWELRAALSLGRWLARRGRLQEARDLLSPVFEWFHEGLDTADLVEARTLLATWKS